LLQCCQEQDVASWFLKRSAELATWMLSWLSTASQLECASKMIGIDIELDYRVRI
jgi:hypothetical protein